MAYKNNKNIHKPIIRKQFDYNTGIPMTGSDFIALNRYTPDYDIEDYDGKINIKSKLLNQMVEKLKELYIDDNVKAFVLQSNKILDSGREFIINSKLKENSIDNIIRDHFKCICTAGCFPASSEEIKWFVFDVDIKKKSKSEVNKDFRRKYRERTRQLNNLRIYTKQLIRTLAKYIPEEYIHCYRSGSKGFHVAIYLEEVYSRQKIQHFQETIRALVKQSIIEEYDDLNNYEIEILPYIKNKNSLGKTAKFPLGRNFKNGDYDTNFCCFVDIKKLRYILKQEEYFLDIKQLDIDAFDKAIDGIDTIAKELAVIRENKYDNESIQINSYIESEDEIIKFISGFRITAHGQRHNMIYDIVIRLKDIYKLNEKEAEKYILIWLSWQRGLYSTAEDLAIKDAISQVKYIYKKNMKFTSGLSNEVNINSRDVKYCLKAVAQSNRISERELNAIRVLIALLIHEKRRNTKEKELFMSYSQIVQTIKIRRNNVNPALKMLSRLGEIKINRVDYSEHIRRANEYALNFKIQNIKKSKDDFIVNIDSKNKIDIYNILKHFYSIEELKKHIK